MRGSVPLPTLLLALLLGPGLASSTSGAEEPSRAAAVLQAFQAAVHEEPSRRLNSRDLLMTPILSEEVEASGRRLHLPRLPPHCGLTVYGGLDPTEATALLARLFAAYGYLARPGTRVEVAGGELALDGYDTKAKVGFVVLPPALGEATAPVPEVDPTLLGWLGRDGRRILVLPLASFASAQEDSVSPLLAAGLSGVDFLNEVTPGEDVDVHGIASADLAELPLPALRAADVPSASTFQFDSGNAFFVARKEGTLELAFPAFGAGTSGAQGVGLLILPWYARTVGGGALPATDLPRFALHQGAMHLRSRRPIFVLPPAFDAAKPFRLEVAYPAGTCTLGGPLTLRR